MKSFRKYEMHTGKCCALSKMRAMCLFDEPKWYSEAKRRVFTTDIGYSNVSGYNTNNLVSFEHPLNTMQAADIIATGITKILLKAITQICGIFD